MTKADIKTIVGSDDQMQWWAAVLFAEISELVDARKAGHNLDSVYRVIEAKVEEFPRLIVNRALEQAKGKLSKLQELEARVIKMEEKLA